MGGLASGIFCVRNFDKVKNNPKEIGRVGAVPANLVSAASDVATRDLGKVSEFAGKAVSSVDDLGKSLLKVEKFSKIASRAVNPLLCGAAAIRAFKDEDTASALVEESCAMGAMLGGEMLIKSVKNPMEKLVKAHSTDFGDIVADLAASKNLTSKLTKKLAGNEGAKNILNKCLKKIGSMSKNKQTLLFIGAELAFVAASICLFDAGKKIGKKITGRDKLETVEQDATANENFFIKKS